jgi:hypothetical protein
MAKIWLLSQNQLSSTLILQKWVMLSWSIVMPEIQVISVLEGYNEYNDWGISQISSETKWTEVTEEKLAEVGKAIDWLNRYSYHEGGRKYSLIRRYPLREIDDLINRANGWQQLEIANNKKRLEEQAAANKAKAEKAVERKRKQLEKLQKELGNV